MDKTDEIFDKIMADLNSEEGSKSFKEWVDRRKKKEDMVLSRCDWFHKKPIEYRIDFIKKVIKKYESKEYINHEYYVCGREPMTCLYWVYYEYAKKYGTNVYDEFVSKHLKAFFFTTDFYKTPENYYVRRMDGQGSVIDVFTEDGLNEYIKSSEKEDE